ncbi:MAG: hypothetical protein ACRYF1_06460 [Janthinobacterium lividum]
MMVLCGGALLVGIAASLAIPFAPFAIALSLAAVLGAAWAALNGVGYGEIFFSAFGLVVCTQVGYGIGLVGAATLEGIFGPLRRPITAKPVPPALSDLHIGEER